MCVLLHWHTYAEITSVLWGPVCSRYLYGEPVQGTAYVVFGLVINNLMMRLPSVKHVSDVSVPGP